MAQIDDWEDVPVDEVDDWEDIPDGPSELESAARGFAQGIPGIGTYADEATGAIESLFTDKSYKQARDESRANYKAAQEANPASYYSGMAVPAIASSIPKAIPVLGTMASGALGAIEGAGASENEDLSGILQDAGIAGGISAATAGLGNLAFKGAKAGLNKLAPKVSEGLKDVADMSAAKAVGLERGTRKKIGDDMARKVGRQFLDTDNLKLFSGTDDLIARNEALKEMAMNERGQIYKLIDDANASKLNPLDMASAAEQKVIGNRPRSYLDTQEDVQRLEPFLQNILSRGDENISMSTGQDLVERLGKEARFDKTRSNAANDMAMGVYHSGRDALNKSGDDALTALGRQDLVGRPDKLNEIYSIGSKADDLVQNKASKEAGNKMFGLTDWIALASGGVDLKSGALLAGKKVAEKYGNTATALGADKLADIVAKSPQSLGKYSDVLQKASQRGGNALGVTDYMLQMNDPEYREMKKQLDGE